LTGFANFTVVVRVGKREEFSNLLDLEFSGSNASSAEKLLYDAATIDPALFYRFDHSLPIVESISASEPHSGDPVTGIPEHAFGDINGDGIVNTLDELILENGWGPCISEDVPCFSDVNSDSVVDILDIVDLLDNYNATSKNPAIPK